MFELSVKEIHQDSPGRTIWTGGNWEKSLYEKLQISYNCRAFLVIEKPLMAFFMPEQSYQKPVIGIQTHDDD